MDWLELLGKVLVFVSFFLLTPVLLQPQTLKRLAEHGASAVSLLVASVVWAVIIIVAAMMLGDLTHTFAKVGAWLFVVGSLLDFTVWTLKHYLPAS